MTKYLPRIGWELLSAEEALDLGLEQPFRWRWYAFSVEWLGRGLTLIVKPEMPA